ncbi:MAG: hypothetical protein LBE56_07275, partial [Tannerella sp.]|nr:hypothetical protein [Tannerella sp.]
MMDFPHEFTTKMQQLLGASYPLLANALQDEPPVSIRLNPAKTVMSMEGYGRLEGEFSGWAGREKVAWCG